MKSKFLIICLSFLSINCAMASNPPSEWIHGDTLIFPETKTSLGMSEYQGLPRKIRVIVFSENFTSFGISCLQGGRFTTFVFKSAIPPTQGMSMEIADTIKCPCEAYDAYANAGWKRNGYNWETGVAYELIRDLPYTLNVADNANGSFTKDYPCDGSIIITAVPNHGYHFTQWSDGVTDNPRTVVMTKDTTFIALFAHNPVITYVCNSQMGRITGPSMTTTGVAAENITFEAIPNYGYHFDHWNDGNTSNPRTIWLSQDTTMEVVFAKNTYTISTESSNPELGTTSGSTSALYLDEILISATPNYGYHFDHWNDGNTQNPRTVTVTDNTTYQAIFAKNTYSITKNAEHGNISGNNYAEYLDEVTLTVNANYGYHFTQWSDGETANPRIFTITQDTTFTAEFVIDKSGNCGNNWALTWSYDSYEKRLTIQGDGAFEQNMQCGVEARTEVVHLVISNGVTSIGNNAFANQSTLQEITLPTTVKTIGEQAFYNCTGLLHIYNYRDRPCVAYSNTFDGIDKFDCTLHVLSSSIDMYKAATSWRDFYYIEPIDAEETTMTTNTASVEPLENTATITWPVSNDAFTYTIEITKDGVVFCRLIFNANGQLTGIAFAPSRNGVHNSPAATMTINGLQFTVTGLNSGTQYGYSITAKDEIDAVVASYSGEFTTTTGETTAIDQIDSERIQANKVIRDGQLFIEKNGKTYNATGAEIK